MMLIDADDLKNDIELQVALVSMFGSEFHELAENLKKSWFETIDRQKTIAAVPVVRCKDCKHSKEDTVFGGRWCQLPGSIKVVKDEFFCAYGVRAEK